MLRTPVDKKRGLRAAGIKPASALPITARAAVLATIVPLGQVVNQALCSLPAIIGYGGA